MSATVGPSTRLFRLAASQSAVVSVAAVGPRSRSATKFKFECEFFSRRPRTGAVAALGQRPVSSAPPHAPIVQDAMAT
eukprot:CAMPEP_0180027892 /NCGR_PEP_ID=MMETSP0984-20121128/25992_1 /TAXON_ID=483367 /ORGANISM="non described non described, Strain CCMP 2436" /LENGTH=77 /DNA_ID=CAMNT_0021952743 /DNA_START=172 /DNA_END=405 /DNA_ORIENTATION=-